MFKGVHPEKVKTRSIFTDYCFHLFDFENLNKFKNMNLIGLHWLILMMYKFFIFLNILLKKIIILYILIFFKYKAINYPSLCLRLITDINIVLAILVLVFIFAQYFKIAWIFFKIHKMEQIYAKNRPWLNANISRAVVLQLLFKGKI